MKKKKRIACLLLVLTVLSYGVRSQAQEIRCFGAAECMEGREEADGIYLLLIGQDSREDAPGKRSDSMILCSFYPERKLLYLTSILRDTYVKIPGYGYDRINAAYAIGGAELLNKTIEENFGVRVDGNVVADFSHFGEIIDILGGVQLELREDEAREINRLVPWQHTEEGLATLTGDQALVYARIRHLDPDGDFSRTGRQRKVLLALADQYRNAGFTAMAEMARKLLPAIETDLNGLELLNYGRLILPMVKDMEIRSEKIPDSGSCHDQNIGGKSVLVPDLPKIRQQLKNQAAA